MTHLLGIPLSFDPAATVLALVGLCVAIQVYRATTFHRVRLVDLAVHWTEDFKGSFLVLESVIRNTGLTIHNPAVCIRFDIPKDDGTKVCQSIQLGEMMDGAFEHGVQARSSLMVKLPLTGFNTSTAAALGAFSEHSFRKTKPRIVIKSGEFEVVSIPLVSQFEPFLGYWNSFAGSINWRLRQNGKTVDGKGWIKERKVLPILGLMASFKLANLGRDAKKELEKAGDDATQSPPSPSFAFQNPFGQHETD